MHMLSLQTPFSRALLAATLLGAVSTQTLASEVPDFAALVKNNGDAVVSIYVDRTIDTGMPDMPQFPPGSPFDEMFKRFFEQIPHGRQHAMAQGSGFIISADGYILTNEHVVDGADAITVGLSDRREFKAKVVGSDERTDVALLKVEAGNLPTVKIGDSDKLNVGDWVLAIGNPFGLDHSATQGIVSALSRNLPNDTYVPFIQTDAAVNPGNSGGPLFNAQGEVIGINSQIYSRSGGYQGVSFAIPINVAMKVAEQLKAHGKVSRGWLGVSIQDLNQALAETFGLDKPRGALVAQVNPDSPADKAGLKSGDVILSYDGTTLERSSQLPPLVANTPVGRKVPLSVLRDGKQMNLVVTVGELPDSSAKTLAKGESQRGTLGVAVAALTAEQRKDLGVGERGVRVTAVSPGSPAAAAGIRPDDVILSYNRQDVTSPDELARLVQQTPPGKTVVVLVQRDGNSRFLAVKMPEKQG
ncbi:MAG TPA: DegQ family serine endoprotease [Candidatus Competibacteraceae bacterium]|nr:DegQ family serine endoprotease [Candidatus Competibacteraceae bacterium]